MLVSLADFYLFSFPSSGNVWRWQCSFLQRATHTCGGKAGWTRQWAFTSLHVVIGAGWFLQHEPCPASPRDNLSLINCQKAAHGLLGLLASMPSPGLCLTDCACRKSGVSQACSENVSPSFPPCPDSSGMGLSQGSSSSP